jgi:hypothetical protein
MNWKNCRQMICMFMQSIILLFFISMGFHSCCKDKHCYGADDLKEIWLYNFASYEIDSVFFVSYKKGSDFRNVIDSFRVPRADSMGYGSYYMYLYGEKITTNNDYKIYFTKINKIYQIMNFKTSESKCNNCSYSIIWYDFTRLDGYEINGKFKSINNISIDKDTD